MARDEQNSPRASGDDGLDRFVQERIVSFAPVAKKKKMSGRLVRQWTWVAGSALQ